MKISGTRRHIFNVILIAGLIISSLSIYSFAGETIIGIPDNFPGTHVADLANYEEFKIDSSGIPSGISYPDGTVTKTDGVLSVTLSAIQYKDGKEVIGFSWSSDIPVSYVFVKGGPGGLLYQYDPATTGAASLFTPLNTNNGKNYGLSHITFYYGQPEDEEPGDEEPGDEEPGDEEPETNDSSEQEIPDKQIPGGLPTDSEQEPVAIEDEQIPEGLTALPQTSGIPAGILYGLGGLLLTAGMYIKKKSR
jgi:hypothetical protein